MFHARKIYTGYQEYGDGGVNNILAHGVFDIMIIFLYIIGMTDNSDR